MGLQKVLSSQSKSTKNLRFWENKFLFHKGPGLIVARVGGMLWFRTHCVRTRAFLGLVRYIVGDKRTQLSLTVLNYITDQAEGSLISCSFSVSGDDMKFGLSGRSGALSSRQAVLPGVLGGRVQFRMFFVSMLGSWAASTGPPGTPGSTAHKSAVSSLLLPE